MKIYKLSSLTFLSAGLSIFVMLSLYQPSTIKKPVLFVSRAIPCCGSVYMKAANALPGVGGFSRFQVAAPAYLCILNPDGHLDTLINGAKPGPNSLNLIDISNPLLNWEADKIVFAGLRDGNYVLGNNNLVPREHNAWRIYVIYTDGSGLKQITFEDPLLDLSQFNPAARGVLQGYDDAHPTWMPDGRICFSSTRFRDIGMYNVTRTSNLYVVNEDGSGLHRITSEKNGADRPVIDPLTGKIVFARWWRNFYWPYDPMTTQAHPQYTKGWSYKDGLTSHLDEVIDGQIFMFNNNAFLLSEINPDGSGLKLFSAHYRDVSLNSAYGGSFNEEGDFIGNWFPIEHQSESSGFGGIKKYFRGTEKKPQGIAGVTSYGNFDYYISDPPSYGIFKGSYAAEPSSTNDGNILFSEAANPLQDYGIYLMNEDGSSKELVLDHPGTTELSAQYVEKRKTPPILLDQFATPSSALPPKGFSDLRQDGSFEFDCRNIFFNGKVDDGILAAPAIGDLATVRFFADPLLSEQYGSIEALNFPILYNELSVDDFGRVLERDAPANVPLFEQGRSSQVRGYKVSRTGGGIMDGAAHVTGFNYGRPGQKVNCVGCHAGHSIIPVPEDPAALLVCNLAPGARVNVSTRMNDPGYLIDKKNYKASQHWFTPEGISPKGQWINLSWIIPLYAQKIVLHNIPDPNRAQVKSCTVRIYEDSLGLKLLEEFNVNQPLSPQGTEILLSKVQKMQSLRFIFNEVTGGIYHWNAATLGEIEVIGSIMPPKRFKEICDCKGKAYGLYRMDSCGQCLLREDPRWNDCLTAVSNTLKEKDWKIYPNPTSHELRIEIKKGNEIGSFKIFDLHGKEMNIPILGSEGNYFAKVEALKTGLYFLEWAHGNKKYFKKWIKI